MCESICDQLANALGGSSRGRYADWTNEMCEQQAAVDEVFVPDKHSVTNIKSMFDMMPDVSTAQPSGVKQGVDLVLTHAMPFGIGDETNTQENVGCVHMRDIVQHRVKPKAHVFGHSHRGYGIFEDDDTIFVNAAAVDDNYTPCSYSAPIVVDIELENEVDFSDQSVIPMRPRYPAPDPF
jgi:hypothetical protein